MNIRASNKLTDKRHDYLREVEGLLFPSDGLGDRYRLCFEQPAAWVNELWYECQQAIGETVDVSIYDPSKKTVFSSVSNDASSDQDTRKKNSFRAVIRRGYHPNATEEERDKAICFHLALAVLIHKKPEEEYKIGMDVLLAEQATEFMPWGKTTFQIFSKFDLASILNTTIFQASIPPRMNRLIISLNGSQEIDQERFATAIVNLLEKNPSINDVHIRHDKFICGVNTDHIRKNFSQTVATAIMSRNSTIKKLDVFIRTTDNSLLFEALKKNTTLNVIHFNLDNVVFNEAANSILSGIADDTSPRYYLLSSNIGFDIDHIQNKLSDTLAKNKDAIIRLHKDYFTRHHFYGENVSPFLREERTAKLIMQGSRSVDQLRVDRLPPDFNATQCGWPIEPHATYKKNHPDASTHRACGIGTQIAARIAFFATHPKVTHLHDVDNDPAYFAALKGAEAERKMR